MCKFSQENYTRDAISKLVKKLHIAGEYPYEILGDYAGLSPSMMRQVADGNRELKAVNFEMLKANLAQREGNLQGFSISLPMNYTIVRIGEVQANGCPDDEVVDGGEALYQFRNGHKATNIEVVDEAIKNLEDVLERAKAERARLAGRKS